MEIQKQPIIQALWQIPMILLVAMCIGLVFNHFRTNGLPPFCPWPPTPPDPDNLNISIIEADQLFQQNKAVFLDARPVELYNKGHIKGALSLPWQNVNEQFINVAEKIPEGVAIITYCDGPVCDLSHKLAEFMIENQFEDVHILVNGWTLWKENNLPIEGSK